MKKTFRQLRNLTAAALGVALLVFLSDNLLQSWVDPQLAHEQGLPPQISLQPSAGFPGARFAVRAYGFRPAEPVSVVLVDPLGIKEDLGYLEANQSGTITLVLSSSLAIPPGQHQMVLRGAESGVQAIKALSVLG